MPQGYPYTFHQLTISSISKCPFYHGFWRIWAYTKAWYKIGGKRGNLSASFFSCLIYSKNCVFNFKLVKYTFLRVKFKSLKKFHVHSNSESHMNNDICYFLCVLEGCTPLNKLSIGKHANMVFRDRNSTPHVTIFWKIFWQELLWQR